MKNILRLVRLIPGNRNRFIIVAIANTILGLIAIGVPLLYSHIINEIASATQNKLGPAEVTTTIIFSLSLLLGLRLVGSIGNYFLERTTDVLFMETNWGLRQRLIEHIMGLSIDYFERTKVGDIMSRVGTATMEIRQWVNYLSQTALLSIINIVFILVVLLIKLPLIGLILLIAVPILMFIAQRRISQTQPIQREWQAIGNRSSGNVSESFSLMTTIRSFGQESRRLEQHREEISLFKSKRLEHFRIEWRLNFISSFVVALITTGALAIVSIGTVQGHYRPGDIFLVLLYVQQLIVNITPIVRLIIMTGEVEVSAEKITEVLDEPVTVRDMPDATELETIESIEFINVFFSYPGKRRGILEDVSFKLENGRTLALVGPSGAGKTTVTKLLMRFYEPTRGTILINGRSITSFTQESIRLHLGTVMQDVALFNESIAANLRFASPDASDSDLRKAAKLAHADVFINKLKDKYDSLVGERGIKLSGGEKQRIAITRAILRNPDLVILDEATSALDSESEQYVQQGLATLMEGKTAIIIAHRLSTIMKADQIIVLQDGKIIERGDHTKLANKKSGLYARLYKLQTEGAIG